MTTDNNKVRSAPSAPRALDSSNGMSKNIKLTKPAALRYRPQPTLIRGILGRALDRYGISKDLARYQFVIHWEKIVGKEIASRAKPECITNGTLIVHVTSSAWAQELSFQKPVILSRLRRFLQTQDVAEASMVRDVMFRVDPGQGAPRAVKR